MWCSDFAFHVGNHVGICRMPMWVRKTDYGALFTCFSSCAVHIEVTNLLDADSFILVFRGFMARSRTVHSVWLENGTIFVGARDELQQAFKEMKHDKIKSFLQENGADCRFYGTATTRCLSYRKGQGTPSWICKNYFGRIDEVPQSLLEWWITQNIDGWSWAYLKTTLCGDHQWLKKWKPISPSNLLMMKTSVVMPPPGEFSKPDAYSKRRWQHVQHIAEESWSRWRKEFL